MISKFKKRDCINLSFYSKDIQKWVKSIFDKWYAEYSIDSECEYSSDYRVSLKDNPKHMAKFEDVIGGCGDQIWEVTGPDGRVYCFGVSIDD